jgi:hypothetical protein
MFIMPRPASLRRVQRAVRSGMRNMALGGRASTHAGVIESSQRARARHDLVLSQRSAGGQIT